MTNTDLITQKVLQITDQVSTLLTNVAPAAAKIILETARFDALNGLMSGIGWAIFTVIIFFVTKNLYKEQSKNGSEALFIFSMMGVIIFCISFFCTLLNLTNIYYWVGLRHPEIYLTHQLMLKVVS